MKRTWGSLVFSSSLAPIKMSLQCTLYNVIPCDHTSLASNLFTSPVVRSSTSKAYSYPDLEPAGKTFEQLEAQYIRHFRLPVSLWDSSPTGTKLNSACRRPWIPSVHHTNSAPSSFTSSPTHVSAPPSNFGTSFGSRSPRTSFSQPLVTLNKVVMRLSDSSDFSSRVMANTLTITGYHNRWPVMTRPNGSYVVGYRRPQYCNNRWMLGCQHSILNNEIYSCGCSMQFHTMNHSWCLSMGRPAVVKHSW